MTADLKESVAHRVDRPAIKNISDLETLKQRLPGGDLEPTFCKIFDFLAFLCFEVDQLRTEVAELKS